MKFKKLFSSLSVASLLLAGCGTSEEAYENGEVNVFMWTEYIPESVIEAFEEEYGIKVNLSTYSSNEDMLSKVKSESEGAYDVVNPSDYMVEQMIAQDMLEELDYDQLSNFSNISEAYLDPSYDPGNVYSVPYMGGVGAIAVNTDKVSIEIDSYADLFDSSLENSLVVLDDYRALIGMVARSMGYSMNETDPDILAEVEEKLLTLKDNIKLYDSDSPKSALISEDCIAGYTWSAEVALAQEENDAIEIVFPSEGAYLFMDNLCIPKGAKNEENALLFINYIMEAETAAAIAEEYPYIMPNSAAVELLGEEYSSNPAKNIPDEVIENGEYVGNLDVDTLAIYDEMWTKLKE